jgi:hypothetical protein
MRCHKCNQDSIKIDNGHIICEICGLDIDVSSLEDPLFDLFFYNENLQEAEKLGKESYIEGKDMGDNPYSIASDQLMLNKRWEAGYSTERDIEEKEALLISAENLKNVLEKLEKLQTAIKEKEQVSDQTIEELREGNSILVERIDNLNSLCVNLEKIVKRVKILEKTKYLLPGRYRREIAKITIKIPDK